MTTKRHEKLFLIYNIFPAIAAENVHIPFIPRCSPFNTVFYGVLCLAPHQLIASGYRGAPALDRGAHNLHFCSTPYGSARPGSDSFCCTQPTKDRCRPLWNEHFNTNPHYSRWKMCTERHFYFSARKIQFFLKTYLLRSFKKKMYDVPLAICFGFSARRT